LSSFETVSFLVSVVAAIISAAALVRSRRNHAQLIELERVHAELSQRQLEELEERDRQAKKAMLHCHMEQNEDHNKFVITNTGQATANDIYFALEQGNEHNPLVQGDFEGKIPFPSLAPGDNYHLLAHIPLSVRQPAYFISLRWQNQDGKQERILRTVAR
jgi:hypothetical protein